MLKAAMGARSNVTLSTTVSSGGSVSGATLASAAGLTQLIDFVLITCPDGRKRLRRLLTIAGAVVTWAPNLPTGQQPANGAAVKGVVTYRMISAANPSLSFAHYLKKTDLSAGLKRNVKGGAPDKLAIKFDPNDDVEMTLSGMAKEVVDAPAQPGGFTMVGGTPASIQAGELLLGNNAAQFLALNFELTNGLWARNDEYGVTAASEIIRRNDPALAVNLNTRVEDETLLFDLTEAGTNVGVFCQTDFTEGKAIAVYMPTVEFMPPRTDDPMEEVKWDFSGVAFETADLALDGLYIALG